MKTLKTFSIIIALALFVSFAKAQNNIDNITHAYFGVKNALAAGNGTEAESRAKDLFTALSAPQTGLTPDQQKIFNNYADKLKFDSRHISETTVIDHQREHFVSLSKNLFEVLKGLKMNSSIIYEQYCPMKKAYWLSETAKIKNPYYNDKEMTTCGKTTATLSAAQ